MLSRPPLPWLGLLLALGGACATWAADLDTLAVTADTQIKAVDADEQAATTFQAVSPSGKIIVWTTDDQLHAYNRETQKGIAAPLQSEIMSDAGLAMLGGMGAMLNGRWGVSFSADEQTVYYPSGTKLVAVSLADGTQTVLVSTTNKEDDENKLVLACDMAADGSKCLYVVGPAMGLPGLGALAGLMGGAALPTPELWVYPTKTKKPVKIAAAKGTGAMWAPDGKSIIFERQDDAQHFGEFYVLDATMKLARIPAGGAGVTVGQPKPATPPATPPADAAAEGAAAEDNGAAAPPVPTTLGGLGALFGAAPGGGSAEAKSPAEGPARFTDFYTTSAAQAHLSGGQLLVIRNFTDGDAQKMLAKSYAFVVDTRTLAATRIDGLPEKVRRVIALDVVEPNILAALCVGEGVSGVYLVDTANQRARLLQQVEDGALADGANLCVRGGNIFVAYDEQIHCLTVGAAEMKALTIALKAPLAAGTVLTIYGPAVNPITTEVEGPDKDALKGKCRVDAADKATQTAAGAQPIEAGDLLVNEQGTVVGEVK